MRVTGFSGHAKERLMLGLPKSIWKNIFIYNFPRTKAFKPFKAFKTKDGNDGESGRR